MNSGILVINKSKLFDPNKSFIELPIVWGIIIAIALVAFFVALVIITNSPLSYDFTSDGFNYFLSAFKFPLGILALIIPIVALLAANHRSEQTKEQIRVTNLQNVFSNHYKHIEEFKKYVEGLNIESINDLRIRKLHKKMFPRSFQGVHSIDADLTREFAQGCEYILKNINMTRDPMNRVLAVNHIDYLMNLFCVDDVKETPNMSYDKSVAYIKSHLSSLYALFVFSHDCPDFVLTSANRCLVQAGNPTYMNQ